jgi:hypothetical protein
MRATQVLQYCLRETVQPLHSLQQRGQVHLPCWEQRIMSLTPYWFSLTPYWFQFNKLSHQPLLDGAADLGMVLDGHNSQLKDAMEFTQRVVDAAKAEEKRNSHHPFHVTTTGHSLGGTLAEITAYRFKLGGESFNSYGAVGLRYDIPEKVPSGYPGFTNHVRATDVVSAGSAHYGEVKTYATAQDIERLRHAGYIDPVNPAKEANPFIAVDVTAHFVNNFAPDKGSATPSILSAADQQRYQDNKQAIEHYRSDVMEDRKVLFGECAGHMTPAQRTQWLESIEAQARQKSLIVRRLEVA